MRQGSGAPRRRRVALVSVFAVCAAGAVLPLSLGFTPGNAAAGSGGAWNLFVSGGAGAEILGYQEHLDPNTADSVLTRCTVGGEQSTCYIDSDATLSNVLLDLRARAEHRSGFLFGGVARIQMSKGTAREAWSVAPNVNGSPGQATAFQHDDLEYRWYRFDVFGGYRLASLLRPIAGIRISRAEQLRDRFEPPPQGIDSATEPIESTWWLAGVLGETAGSGLVAGYRFLAGGPISVTTTNSAIPAAEFTGAGGYLVEGGGYLAIPVSPVARLRFDVEGGAMHWNGSDVEDLGQGRIAKWPENDTQMIILSGSVELTL